MSSLWCRAAERSAWFIANGGPGAVGEDPQEAPRAQIVDEHRHLGPTGRQRRAPAVGIGRGRRGRLVGGLVGGLVGELVRVGARVDAVRGRRAAAALARERVDAVGRRGRVVVAVVAAARIAAGDAVGEGAAVSRHALPAARGVRGAGGKGDHDERQERAALHSFSSIPRSAVPHAPAARVGHRVSVAGS